MMDECITEHVEESEQISPIVVQDKKTIGEVCIFIDLRKLNDAFLHDPFSNSFTNEVLESVKGKEIYSFTDGFSSYHQFKITKED